MRYLLLVAEADYLCGEPMIRDTAVHGAVEFFRSGAQKRLCARALLMRAAVRQEMADTLAGLGSWWNALPASERAGDGESMRLLRSVVGSMYSLMPDCGAEQYAAALDSLERRLRHICHWPTDYSAMLRDRLLTILLSV